MCANVAIVTGASSGIGREFVRQLANEQGIDRIYAVARRKERLIDLQAELGEKVVPLALDVLTENPVSYLQEGERLLWAVHSAGVGYSGSCESLTVKQQTDTVDLNCKAAVAFITQAAEKCQKGGKIVCIASAAAFTPQPYFAAYAASKSFVLSFCRALAVELKRKGVTVTSVCPGPVNTEFFLTSSKDGKVADSKAKYMVTPESVAAQGVKAAKKGKQVCVPSRSMKLGRLAAKLLPHSLLMRVYKEQ